MSHGSHSARLFFKFLVGYLVIYAYVLWSWKKPHPLLKGDYLKHYDFESAPIWELDEALYLNGKTCPPNEVNYDRNAVKQNKQAWASITEEQIYDWRRGILQHLKDANHDGETSGRGIVMAAGDTAAMQRAHVNIALLRHYGCKLPVHIYHYEDENEHLDQALIDKLSALHADVIEVIGLKRGTDWKAYHIKAVVIQRCHFDEILYLDTDSYLAKDPTYLFDAKPFRETGVMLWPDFTKSHPTNPVWRLLGMPCRPEFEGESGQILINRFMHQRSMHIAEYFALNYDKFYSFMGGDRDSFRISLLAEGKTWSGPSRMVATAGLDRTFGGHTMMQADHVGNWLFVHANLLKHTTIPRDSENIWEIFTRVRNDTFTGPYGYGTLAGNEKLGDGIRLDVAPSPAMFTEYSSFRDDEKESAVAEWQKKKLVKDGFRGVDLALIEFEQLFLKYGGKRN